MVGQMEPIAAFTWQMEPRARGWVDAWDPDRNAYDPGYLNPRSWRVRLDAGASTGGDCPITGYRWVVTGLDDPGSQRTIERGVGSPASVDVQLPAQGRYRVEVTVTDQRGRRSRAAVREITVRDLLVVSLGDSSVSGEGNPADTSPQWVDQRCHRSLLCGPALAAEMLERGEGSPSVTFLSFACSGAEIDMGLLGSYDGVEPGPATTPLPAQIKAVERVAAAGRPIDALLLAAGLNDLGFIPFVLAATTPAVLRGAFGSPLDEIKQHAERQFALLPAKFDRIAFALSRRLNGAVRQVYITEYPADPFHRDGGERGGGLFSAISSDEAEYVFAKGTELNQIIQDAAARHGWAFVGGITGAFQGHGFYCDDSFYIGLKDALDLRDSAAGMVHPNVRGQRVWAEHIHDAIRTHQPVARTPQRVTVTFESVTVVPRPGSRTLDRVGVSLRVNDRHVCVSVPPGRTSELSGPGRDMSCVVGNGLAAVVDVAAMSPDGSISERFGASDRFGAGPHALAGECGGLYLEVRYRIHVEPEEGECGRADELDVLAPRDRGRAEHRSRVSLR